jgi:hypothetical protein
MALRPHHVIVVAGILASLGAAYPTTNFLVEAPTPQIAQQVGQAAEYYRRQKAMEWLGYEMPSWRERCPLRVKVGFGGPGGATSFAFDQGQVLGQNMNIEGPLDRLLASVLPHEVTHTVFAYHFRHPVPRWADEGGAVLSEDDIEKDRHDKLVRHILNTPGRKIPLRRLFALRDYPGDVMVLYAEGFSVANFLVSKSDRKTFLAFVGQGMSTNGWDYAVRAYYPPYNSVEDLEEAWLAQLRATRRPPVQLAQNLQPGPAAADPTNRLVVRQTVPPTLLTPIYRGQAPASGQEGDRFGSGAQTRVAVRPGYLPDYLPPAAGPATDPWQPAGPPVADPPAVQLGPPQPAPPPRRMAPPAPVPATASPIGYPQ